MLKKPKQPTQPRPPSPDLPYTQNPNAKRSTDINPGKGNLWNPRAPKVKISAPGTGAPGVNVPRSSSPGNILKLGLGTLIRSSRKVLTDSQEIEREKARMTDMMNSIANN